MWRSVVPVASLVTLGYTYAHNASRRSLHCDYKPLNPSGFPQSLKHDNGSYVLVTAGTRRVTFLSIAVYDIGIYVHEEDMHKLREAIRAAQFDSSERAEQNLADPLQGERFLQRLIPEISFAVRIVPVRNTDIAHIRDGFVRGILAREANPDAAALQAFKEFFPNPKKPLKKGTVMNLFAYKGMPGAIHMTLDDHEYGTFSLADGRNLITAFVANYICGTKVASEPVRRDFVRQIVHDSESC